MEEEHLLAEHSTDLLASSPIMSCRQANKNDPFISLRIPTTCYDSPKMIRTHTDTSKCKSSNLQATIRKPIKIKMFEKDTEKMKVMCFEFPMEGTAPCVEFLEDDGFNGLVVQNMSTAYRGLALSKFKILRSFFSNYQ